MFREVRRKDRIMDEQRTLELLTRGEYGILASVSEDNRPYATPLSYVFLDGAVYFHCATTGHKLDNIARSPSVSFAVVGETEPVFQKDFSTRYESVVLFGTAALIEDREERHRALVALCEKYLPEHAHKAPEYIDRSDKATAVVKISVEHISGKRKA